MPALTPTGRLDLEFRLLGPVQVVRDGVPIALGPPKARALLGYLVLHRDETVSVARLLEVLWADGPPVSARHALQIYVAVLRQALEPDRAPGQPATVLVTQPPGYRLVAGRDHIDLTRFAQLAAEGRRWLATGHPDEAAASLRTALELWHGEPLADLTDLPFAAAAAQRLAEERLAALEDRIDADLAAGRHADVVGELAGRIEEDPLRERPYAQLMLALYRCGRQAEALARYQQLRHRLDAEGLTPGARVAELQIAILQQSPALAGP